MSTRGRNSGNGPSCPETRARLLGGTLVVAVAACACLALVAFGGTDVPNEGQVPPTGLAAPDPQVAAFRFFRAWQEGDPWSMYELLSQRIKDSIDREAFVGGLLRPQRAPKGETPAVRGILRLPPIRYDISRVRAGMHDGVAEYKVALQGPRLVPLDFVGLDGFDVSLPDLDLLGVVGEDAPDYWESYLRPVFADALAQASEGASFTYDEEYVSELYSERLSLRYRIGDFQLGGEPLRLVREGEDWRINNVFVPCPMAHPDAQGVPEAIRDAWGHQ